MIMEVDVVVVVVCWVEGGGGLDGSFVGGGGLDGSYVGLVVVV